MQDLLVLTSPPASGKTFWIESFSSNLSDSPLVISPLRALADECQNKWQDKIQIMTPEAWLLNSVEAKVVIFDEFHLFFYWGDSFRSKMWEAFYGLVLEAELCILLTATLSEAMINELSLYTHHFDRIIWSDHGNRQLKYHPQNYIKLPAKKWMLSLITMTPLISDEVQLIFCAYRQEVMALGSALEQQGYRVWTCVGGEAGRMKDMMATGGLPHFIVSTTVLSHGVNLPRISTIYFFYELKNIDFWIQMVARGGRKGEAYKVFSLERPYNLKWASWQNLFMVLQFWVKIKIYDFLKSSTQWFLKD